MLVVTGLVLLNWLYSSSSATYIDDVPSYNRRLMIMGRPFHGLRPILATREEVESSARASKTLISDNVTLLIDHGDPTVGSFSARYWYNNKFYANTGVAFLDVGGEAPAGPGWINQDSLPFDQWAMANGAAMFELEHRFYGESRPFSDQSTENLKYLTSVQAVEDVADFIRQMNQKYFLTVPKPKWVIFGGSYAGALALWIRARFPDLTAGAVGSSGPVFAKLDFYEYLQVVEQSLRKYDPYCANAVGEAFQQMTGMMNSEFGRQTLSLAFNLCIPLANTSLMTNDIESFYATIYGNFQIAVQYSGIISPGIPDVCRIMINTSLGSAMYRVAAVNRLINGNGCTDADYHSMIDMLKVVDWSDSSADRSWTWQTCNEFGYFQSTDIGRNIFGSTAPNNLFINICKDVFNITVTQIADAIDRTNAYYGGRDQYNGTNVVAPNGMVDPWHALGLYKPWSASVQPYLIEGTAHCADMYTLTNNSLPGLFAVQELIGNSIRGWLQAPVEPNDNVAPPKTPMRTAIQFVSRSVEMPLANEPTPEQKQKALDRWRGLNKFLMGRSMHGFLPEPPGESMSSDDNPPGFRAAAVLQPLDHFDYLNPRTFMQRYWYNPQFAQPNGPIFLFLGGESAANMKWILNENITYLTWAEKHGAHAFFLEHRYYGETRPTVDQSTENLKYLSSEQALEDTATFIRTINREYKFVNPKWVTFGGSYAGALSAWFRQRFSDLTVAAVASSAPVEAKLDFYEYLQVTEASIRTHSNECAERVRRGFMQMHYLSLTPEGRTNLTNLFTLVPAFNESTLREVDLQYFFSNIYGQFQGAVQYSGDNTDKNGYGIPEACALVLNASSDIGALVDVNKLMATLYEGSFTSTDNRYENMVEFLKDTSWDDAAGAVSAARSWTWQTCTEFGYFQSTDLGYNIFGSTTPLNFFIDLCSDVFGPQFTIDRISSMIDTVQARYGGRTGYRSTNVILPHGSLDPWSALRIVSNNESSVVPRLITGTAHCADMYPARPQDPADLTAARQLIDQNLASWLPVRVDDSSTISTPMATSTLPTVTTTPTTIIMTTANASIASANDTTTTTTVSKTTPITVPNWTTIIMTPANASIASANDTTTTMTTLSTATPTAMPITVTTTTTPAPTTSSSSTLQASAFLILFAMCIVHRN